MKLIVFGANGGTGRELVTQALERGHDVTAFVRNPAKLRISHERLAVARGNVMEAASRERHQPLERRQETEQSPQQERGA